MKATKRKAFNFLRSYFDVFNELKDDADKLSFLTAIINKQFLNEDPDKLNFLVNLCYESQRHSIETSVKGWIRVNKTDMQGNKSTNPPSDPMTNPPSDPMTNPQEEEEKEEEKEKLKKELETLKAELEKLKAEKPKKEKTSIQPTLEEIEKYFSEKGYNKQLAKTFYDYYSAAEWKDKNGSKVLSWKQKAIANWFKDENKTPQQQLQKPKDNSWMDTAFGEVNPDFKRTY